MRKARSPMRRGSTTMIVGEKERNWWVYIVLSVVSIVCVLPFLWVILTAFKDRITAFNVPPT